MIVDLTTSIIHFTITIFTELIVGGMALGVIALLMFLFTILAKR